MAGVTVGSRWKHADGSDGVVTGFGLHELRNFRDLTHHTHSPRGRFWKLRNFRNWKGMAVADSRGRPSGG